MASQATIFLLYVSEAVRFNYRPKSEILRFETLTRIGRISVDNIRVTLVLVTLASPI